MASSLKSTFGDELISLCESKSNEGREKNPEMPIEVEDRIVDFGCEGVERLPGLEMRGSNARGVGVVGREGLGWSELPMSAGVPSGDDEQQGGQRGGVGKRRGGVLGGEDVVKDFDQRKSVDRLRALKC